MAKTSFAVDLRTKTGTSNVRRLRKERIIPGVIVGLGEDAINIQSDLIGLERLFYTAGESTVIDLKVNDKDHYDVLINDVSFHPVTNEVSHIEFFRIDPKKKIHTTIPLNFVGVSPAVKLGGLLIINRDTVDIECLPKDLVHEIKIPLETLSEVGMHLSVSDINFPEGMTPTIPAGVVLVHVEEPRKAEVEVVAETAEESSEDNNDDEENKEE